MKLTCPKCQSQLKVPADKIPAAGGWARCPHCAEKFFVKAPGSEIDLLSQIPGDGSAGRLGRNAEGRRLLDRLRAAGRAPEAAKEPDWSDFISSEVTIFPEPAPTPALYQALGLALLGLPVLLLGLFFVWYESPPQPVASTVVFDKTFNNEQDPKQILANLDTIRRNMANQKRIISTVRRTGSESRVFNYFAARLMPGTCDAISRLEMTSEAPTKGFEATGFCIGGKVNWLKMEVVWTNRTAIISFPHYSKAEEMEMYPIEPRVVRTSEVN